MIYAALDIGNVLCNTDFNGFLRYLSKKLNISLDDAKYFMNKMQKSHDLGHTIIANELKDYFKINSSVIVDEVLLEWHYAVTPNIKIINMFNSLCDNNNLQIALLSNIGLEHAEVMKSKLSHNGFFDNAVKYFSCYVGARKPSSIYYQTFLLQFPEFKGCVYADDLQENLDTSKQFGFQTFKFDLSASMDIDTELDKLKTLVLSQ